MYRSMVWFLAGCFAMKFTQCYAECFTLTLSVPPLTMTLIKDQNDRRPGSTIYNRQLRVNNTRSIDYLPRCSNMKIFEYRIFLATFFLHIAVFVTKISFYQATRVLVQGMHGKRQRRCQQFVLHCHVLHVFTITQWMS